LSANLTLLNAVAFPMPDSPIPHQYSESAKYHLPSYCICFCPDGTVDILNGFNPRNLVVTIQPEELLPWLQAHCMENYEYTIAKAEADATRRKELADLMPTDDPDDLLKSLGL